MRSLCGNVFKNVVDKGVQDGHCLVGHTSARVYFEHLVDV
jgi:hypothetical protein